MPKENTNAKEENWKSAIVPFVALEIGGHIEGEYVEFKKVGERTNSTSGEVTDHLQCFFKRKNGETFKIEGNAGLKNALDSTTVKPGDYIRVVRMEKKKIPGRAGEVNQYDILIRS